MSSGQAYEYDSESDNTLTILKIKDGFEGHKKDLKEAPEVPFPTLYYAQQDERGAAEYASIIFKNKYLFNHTISSFMYFEGGVLKTDNIGKARIEILSKIREAFLEESKKTDDLLIALLKQNNQKSIDDASRLGKERDLLRKRVHELNKRSHIDNVLNLLSNYLPAISNDFDKNPRLLNLKNGTYDFESGFRKHNFDDLLSKQTLIDYDSNATCEKWITFLNLIFKNNAALIRFIQKLIGYSLTGLTDIQALFFCYGSGANGKSTFFAVLKMLIGDYFTSIPIETLLAKQNDSTVEYQLSKMKGARVVLASEVPQNRILNESKIKDLTGGEMINARNPHEKPFSFVPTHKLWMFGNHKPIIKGTDHGIWRRIILIPFSFTIPEDQKREMSEVLEEMKQELQGILNWAIEGYGDYKENGLNQPDVVMQETKKYKEESDALSSFFEERCTINEHAQCPAKQLYQAYLDWCEEEKETPAFKNSRKMIEALIEKGFVKFNATGNTLTIRGIDLKTKQKQDFTNKES